MERERLKSCSEPVIETLDDIRARKSRTKEECFSKATHKRLTLKTWDLTTLTVRSQVDSRWPQIFPVAPKNYKSVPCTLKHDLLWNNFFP